mmetsp:Transcript_56174/g.162780  ORF Transcript_56174/g.162780 Transcript_56174/m.162780 type:complete len:200 (+) Transcript_56174:176-775(+)
MRHGGAPRRSGDGEPRRCGDTSFCFSYGRRRGASRHRAMAPQMSLARRPKKPRPCSCRPPGSLGSPSMTRGMSRTAGWGRSCSREATTSGQAASLRARRPALRRSPSGRLHMARAPSPMWLLPVEAMRVCSRRWGALTLLPCRLLASDTPSLTTPWCHARRLRWRALRSARVPKGRRGARTSGHCSWAGPPPSLHRRRP